MLNIDALLKILGDYGFQYLFIAIIFYYLIQFANIGLNYVRNKADNRIEVKKEEKNEQEIETSRLKLLSIQRYLEDNREEFFKQGIDRVNIWINHNGTRKGDFHFIFYSLIAEITAQGLEKFHTFNIRPEKIPYYTMAEYEEQITESDGSFFVSDINDLGPTARAIAKDTGAKSMYARSICNIKGQIEGIVFCTSVFKPMTERPHVKDHIENIRALFING